jgi:hypothetical protein
MLGSTPNSKKNCIHLWRYWKKCCFFRCYTVAFLEDRKYSSLAPYGGFAFIAAWGSLFFWWLHCFGFFCYNIYSLFVNKQLDYHGIWKLLILHTSFVNIFVFILSVVYDRSWHWCIYLYISHFVTKLVRGSVSLDDVPKRLKFSVKDTSLPTPLPFLKNWICLDSLF